MSVRSLATGYMRASPPDPLTRAILPEAPHDVVRLLVVEPGIGRHAARGRAMALPASRLVKRLAGRHVLRARLGHPDGQGRHRGHRSRPVIMLPLSFPSAPAGLLRPVAAPGTDPMSGARSHAGAAKVPRRPPGRRGETRSVDGRQLVDRAFVDGRVEAPVGSKNHRPEPRQFIGRVISVTSRTVRSSLNSMTSMRWPIGVPPKPMPMMPDDHRAVPAPHCSPCRKAAEPCPATAPCSSTPAAWR